MVDADPGRKVAERSRVESRDGGAGSSSRGGPRGTNGAGMESPETPGRFKGYWEGKMGASEICSGGGI